MEKLIWARLQTRGEKGAKEARLSCRLLKQWDQEALVEICLDTGRFHQIRLQMAHAGLPLAGDRKYNPDGEEILCIVRLRAGFSLSWGSKTNGFLSCPSRN